jgi:hypothetical protein
MRENDMGSELKLYWTPACHLCEEALVILHPIINTYCLIMHQIDITENDELLDRYGLRIPVLALNSLELEWPFDAEQVLTILQCQKD